MHGIGQLALATLAGNPFADATDEFFRDFGQALDRATGSRVNIIRPFARLQKTDVLKLGRGLPLELTLSCIAPVDGLHCGRCNKCAERRRAFVSAALEDRTGYINEPENTGGEMTKHEDDNARNDEIRMTKDEKGDSSFVLGTSFVICHLNFVISKICSPSHVKSTSAMATGC